MFRSHALETVGQQQDHPRKLLPFVFRARDELVNEDLGGVDEVAELGFPQYQPFRKVEAIAVFKPSTPDSQSGLFTISTGACLAEMCAMGHTDRHPSDRTRPHGDG